jgi:MFS family permease
MPFDTGVTTERTGISTSNRRMLLSCFLGTTIEWYDFLVYGFLGPLVFSGLFFPSLNPLAGTLAVWSVFAVGFAARPIGGVFFAHFGDRLGRKPILVSTLVMMGASTTAMGLIPTYAQIGITAPIILVCLRFLQGFSLGGESAAGPLLAMESAPGNTRGFFAALVSSGAAAGTVLGALAVFLVGALPQDALLSWGWRLPFIASAFIFAISFYVRMRVEESPDFQQALARKPAERVPVLTVLEHCKIPTLQVLFCAMAESSTFYFTSVFGLSYGAQTLHLSSRLLLAGVALGNGVGILTNPLFGAMSDRIGRKPLLGLSYLASAVYVVTLFFPLLQTKVPLLVLVAMAIPGAILQPMSLAVSGSFYPERFADPRLRLSGVSLGRQVGTILGGGLMPYIAASLIAQNNGALTWALAYFSGVCTAGLIAVLSARETSHVALARL